MTQSIDALVEARKALMNALEELNTVDSRPKLGGVDSHENRGREQLLYRIQDVAAMLGVGKSTVYEMIWSGELKSIPIGQRGRRIHRDEVHRWIEEQISES